MIKHKHDGFTIIELITVVVVIAILATVTVVSYNGVTRSARETAVKSDLSNSSKGFEVEQLKFISGYNPKSTDYLYKESENTITQYMYGNSKFFCMQSQSKKNTEVVFHIININNDNVTNSGACPTPDFSTTYRCVAGKVYSVATIKNTTSEPISLKIVHNSTSEEQPATSLINPGSTASAAYTLRLTSVPRSIIDFKVYNASGEHINTYFQSQPARTC